ncbi:hypothetical protein SAMN04487866_11260 [Thermoactinomyces sp. DSM 45891]|uniref:hypothetical protein n=1 Tax=Thermoactinomyces sp. DSM 45891 TaxID=1761907 RepID=UPI00092408E4|nr:hypothetical protein [Thermoactinomyces sp. DSM 45891]SFX57925.1 hypothetical protein SAMN04487866_11260 [Thermoactinomyces sp. DSM 45891]
MRPLRIEFPTRHIEGNLTFGQDGSVWAYYEIKRAEHESKQMHARFQDAHLSEEYHYIQVPCYTNRQANSELKWFSFEEETSIHSDQPPQLISEITNSYTEIRVFIGFRLRKPNQRQLKNHLRRRWKHKIRDFIRYLYSVTGIAEGEILEEELFEYTGQEELLFQSLRGFMSIHRLSTYDLKWYIRQHVYQDHKLPLSNEKGRLVTELGISTLTLDDSEIEIHPHHIRTVHVEEATGEVREVYTSYLYAVYFPEDLQFPGKSEWAYLTNIFDFPVSISARKEMDSLEDVHFMTVVFGVSAKNEDILAERVNKIVSEYRQYEIEVQLCPDNQFVGYSDFLPCGEQYERSVSLISRIHSTPIQIENSSDFLW